jgi:hypothetical protein
MLDSKALLTIAIVIISIIASKIRVSTLVSKKILLKTN